MPPRPGHPASALLQTACDLIYTSKYIDAYDDGAVGGQPGRAGQEMSGTAVRPHGLA